MAAMSEDGPIIFSLVIGCIFIPSGIALLGMSSDIATISGINLVMLAGIGLLITGVGSLILGVLFVFGNRSG
jgi:hypothetical protein